MEDFNRDNNFEQVNDEPCIAPESQSDTSAEEKPTKWAAITSFVISIVNLCTCCYFGYVAIVASYFLGIMSLVKKWGAKGMAIAGVAISTVCLILTLGAELFLNDLSKCLNDVMNTAPQYYEEYSETGELPEEMEKYNTDDYSWYWSLIGVKDFAGFYDFYMNIYGAINSKTESESNEAPIDDDDFFNYDDNYSSDEDSEPEFGEAPVSLY